MVPRSPERNLILMLLTSGLLKPCHKSPHQLQGPLYLDYRHVGVGGEVIDRAGQRLQTVCQGVGVMLRPRLQGENIGVQRQKYQPDSQQNVCFIQPTLTTCKGILYCELLKFFIKYNQILPSLEQFPTDSEL